MNQNLSVCTADDTVRSLAERIRREPVSVFLVCSSDGVVEGIATKQSILSASWRSPSASAGDIMSTVLEFCGPDEAAEEAASRLIQSGAAVVLIEEDNEVLGWIAPHDLARLSRHWPLARAQQMPTGFDQGP